MPVIAEVSGTLGEHRYQQSEITAAFGEVVLRSDPGESPVRRDTLHRVHQATAVESRHLALPLDEYGTLTTFAQANDAFLDVGVRLASAAVGDALAGARLSPEAVDLIVSATVTGIAAPSLDSRLVQPLGLRSDVKRIPIFGLGCVAGAAGIARVADYLRGHPDEVAVFVCAELCSLTVQHDDESMANIVAAGLFGDGAAAVVMVGDRRAESLGVTGPRVRASRSVFYPDTERVMGWDVGGSGFRIVLAPTVADIVRNNLGEGVKAFLADHGLDRCDVVHWVAHPGGPKVLLAMEEALTVDRAALQVTWDSLKSVGNLSSASVVHILRDTLVSHPGGSGAPAVLLAMGPGFCAELVLLEW